MLRDEDRHVLRAHSVYVARSIKEHALCGEYTIGFRCLIVSALFYTPDRIGMRSVDLQDEGLDLFQCYCVHIRCFVFILES